MSRLRWLPVAFVGALIALGAITLSFSTFMIYDDEGYVLFSLKTFAEGGGLYSRVYSQYGPFFFLFNQALHFVGLQFTNTDGRIVALVCWLGAIGLCGAMVWRFTRSPVATCFVMGGVWLHLWEMISEPSHPGGLIVLVTALAAWLGARWSGQSRKLAAAVGLAAAALLLTKINVGVFLFAAAGAWWLLYLDDARFPLRLRTAIAAVALAVMPLALMRPLLDQGWAATFALTAGVGGMTTVLAAARGASTTTRWRDLGWLALTASAVVAITFLAIWRQGTSWSDLLEGVVLGPLRHPLVYTAPFHWHDGSAAVGVISLLLAGWVAFGPASHRFAIIATGRLVTASFYLTSWLIGVPASTDNYTLSYCISAGWFFVQPLGGDADTQPIRAWLGLIFVTQALHAFPVAGSQISWGTFLLLPLIVIGVHDLVRLHAGGAQRAVRALRFIAAGTLFLATSARCAQFAWLGYTRVRDSDSLHLPGADSLRLPESFTTGLRVLARNASAHADMLFSFPGLLSFHLWTNVPPPTAANATHWFNLLAPAQQEEIRARLAADPRACVIMQRNLYDFLVRTNVPMSSPLALWLQDNFEPAFTMETYEFWVRKGRHIAVLDTAAIFESAVAGQPHYRISLTLAASNLKAISAIELGRFDRDRSTLIKTWTNADAQLVLTPINSAGAEAGAQRRVTFPFDAAGLVRIDLLIDQLPPKSPPSRCVLYLRDASGARVAELRFIR